MIPASDILDEIGRRGRSLLVVSIVALLLLCPLSSCSPVRQSNDTADAAGSTISGVPSDSSNNPATNSSLSSPPDVGNATGNLSDHPDSPAVSLFAAGLDTVKTTAFDVYDGDTFHVMIDGNDEKVRVTGVDTPEIGSTDANEAKAAIVARDFTAGLVDGKTVYLVYERSAPRDQYGRFLAYVWLEKPPNTLASAKADIGGTLNGRLLSGGYATTMIIEPNTTFAEELAVLAGGSGAQVPPLVTTQPSQGTDVGGNGPQQKGPGTEYYIKGNISVNTGEKIYHMPGQRYYDETIIDESKGERWFRSEEEAQAAGWRKSKV